MGTKTPISQLGLTETQNRILSQIATPRTTYMIAARLRKSYSSINQNLGILTALGYAVRIKSPTGKVVYKLAETLENS